MEMKMVPLMDGMERVSFYVTFSISDVTLSKSNVGFFISTVTPLHELMPGWFIIEMVEVTIKLEILTFFFCSGFIWFAVMKLVI